MKFRISDFGFRTIHPPSPDMPRSATNPKSEIRNPKSGEAGYTLAIFVMVIAIMAIFMAVAVQMVSFQAQRENEAELIFRGRQYVEGIRLYRQKYGRYPMRMKELWEADPRVLRRKWTDPITRSEKWGVIFKGEEGRELTGSGVGGDRPTPTRTPVFERDRENEGEKVGPIVGVHSLSTETSIKVYEGRTQYDMWKFTLREEQRSRRSDDSGDRDDTDTTKRTPTRRPDTTGTPNR